MNYAEVCRPSPALPVRIVKREKAHRCCLRRRVLARPDRQDPQPRLGSEYPAGPVCRNKQTMSEEHHA